jgi:Alpha/beta hydrolase family
VKQFPVFVDVGDRHVAAVVTVPERDPSGLVISLAGTGRHNLVGSTLCAHLSQRVVEEGLASVRFDYSGVGDSPGHVPAWSLSDVEAVARQADAVLSSAMALLDVSRFAAVGTCYGSRVALSLVPHASCLGAICLAPPVLEYGGVSRLGRQVGERTVLSYVRSHAALRRMARPLRRTMRANKLAPVVTAAFEHLDRARIVFLYGTEPQDDHYSRRAQEVLDESLARLPAERQERFALRMLPWGPLSTFDILAPEEQNEVLGVVLPLLQGWFDEAGVAPSSAAALAG